jgi:hypothetical protein
MRMNGNRSGLPTLIPGISITNSQTITKEQQALIEVSILGDGIVNVA